MRRKLSASTWCNFMRSQYCYILYVDQPCTCGCHDNATSAALNGIELAISVCNLSTSDEFCTLHRNSVIKQVDFKWHARDPSALQVMVMVMVMVMMIIMMMMRINILMFLKVLNYPLEVETCSKEAKRDDSGRWWWRKYPKSCSYAKTKQLVSSVVAPFNIEWR